MKIALGTNTYQVSWYHESDWTPPAGWRVDRKATFGSELIKGRTLCHIRMVRDKVSPVVGYGEAWCSLKDSYTKEAGRKIALARALENGVFNKLERQAVWERYLNRNVQAQAVGKS